MRRRVVLAPLAGLVLLLAGCVGIPTSGSVQTAPINADPDEQSQIALPERPIPGQSMQEILEGFIRAGRGPQNSYSVAKEYLAPNADWSGTARVLISSSAIVPEQVDDDTFSLTLNVAAEVDVTGRYVTSASTQTLLYDFTVVDGEFRISSAAPGTVLTPSGFAGTFDEYPLYFFDPSFSFLVPDLRWFPTNNSIADRIVRELVAGQAPWLQAGVLVSAFPVGIEGRGELEAPRVDVTLSAEARAESALAQQRMRWQLDESLIGPLRNVTDVEVTADGLSLANDPAAVLPESRYSVQDVIGGVDGGFGEFAADGTVTLLPKIGGRVNALEPQQAALSRNRDAVAVLGPAGVSLVGGSGDAVPIDSRPGLIAPTIDPRGFVWTVQGDNPGGLLATGPGGVVHQIRLDVDGQVVSIELSRDGTRLLVAANTSSGPRLFVAGVIGDADLAPVALGTPFELPIGGSIVDVAWVDEVRVAVLRTTESGTTVEVLPLGGPIDSLGPVDDGIAIVGGNLKEGLRVLSASGAVLRPSGAGGWVDTGLIASFLGTQQ